MTLFYKETITNSDNDTYLLGHLLGQELVGGDVLLLNGELGSGKTTFTKGVAKALGINSLIISPTFQIVREYKRSDLTLYHIDMYRTSSKEANYLGIEELLSKKNILIIEWNKLDLIRQIRHYEVNFNYVSDNSRKISIKLNEES